MRILGSKIEEFPCLVHKLSVILTALQYTNRGLKWRTHGPLVASLHK